MLDLVVVAADCIFKHIMVVDVPLTLNQTWHMIWFVFHPDTNFMAASVLNIKNQSRIVANKTEDEST